jgi:hypothetical protein
MTKKTKYVGRESLKSSNKWFGGTGNPRGNGASAGDGKTTDKTIVGKIVAVFKSS